MVSVSLFLWINNTLIMGNSLSYEIKTFTGTSFDSMVCIAPNTERTPLWMYAKALCFAGSLSLRVIIFNFEVLSFNSHTLIPVLGLLKWILQPEKYTEIIPFLWDFPQWCCWECTYNKVQGGKWGSTDLTQCSFVKELVMLVWGEQLNFLKLFFLSYPDILWCKKISHYKGYLKLPHPFYCLIFPPPYFTNSFWFPSDSDERFYT